MPIKRTRASGHAADLAIRCPDAPSRYAVLRCDGFQSYEIAPPRLLRFLLGLVFEGTYKAVSFLSLLSFFSHQAIKPLYHTINPLDHIPQSQTHTTTSSYISSAKVKARNTKQTHHVLPIHHFPLPRPHQVRRLPHGSNPNRKLGDEEQKRKLEQC